MRANEFIVEGPGDWMQAQVIGRKQKDRAKAAKQNIPKITKLLQQNLAAAVNKLSSSDDDGLLPARLKQLVGKLLSKSLSVDVTNNKTVDYLLGLIKQNPEGVATDAQVTAAISKIVTDSFKSKQTHALASKEVKSQMAKEIAQEISKDSSVAEISDAVNGVFKKHDMAAAGLVTSSNRNIADAIYAELERKTPIKAVEQILMGDLSQGKATPDAADTTPAAGDRTPTGQSIEELKDGIKDALMAAHDAIATDRDRASEYVQRQLTRNGMKDEESMADLADEIMQDPDLPFNFKPDDKFRGLVYSPNGTRYKVNSDEDNVAFVKHKDRWTQWTIGPKNIWKYKTTVRQDEQKALDLLAKQATNDVIPLAFRQDKTGDAVGMYTVTTK